MRATGRKKLKYRKKSAPKTELRRSFEKFNWRLAGKLAASFVVTFVVYMVFVHYNMPFIIHTYAVALFVLSVAYVLLARGYSCKPFDESLFPDDWDAARRAEYLLGDVRRKKIAKTLLLFIIPIMLTFMFDMIYINFLSK